MGIGNVFTPGLSGSATGFQPFAALSPFTFNPKIVRPTIAQCCALNGTPLLIVPGVGGALIVPIVIAKRVNVTGAFSAVLNVSFRYVGTSVNAFTGFSMFANGVARYDTLQYVSVGFSNNASDLRGLGIEMFNTGANPAPGTFDAEGMKLTMFYSIIPW